MHLPHLPVSVYIPKSTGERLTEYKQTTIGDSTTCYIESRPGEEWCLGSEWEQSEGSRGKYDYRGRVSVDGKQIEKSTVQRRFTSNTCSGVRSQDGSRVRPFVFSTLAVGDSDDEGVQILDEATVKGLGSIVFTLFEGTYGPGQLMVKPSDAPATVDPVKVHEKMKKKTSEVTTLGDTRSDSSYKYYIKFTKSRPSRKYTFTFLYRSAALLDLEGIEVVVPILPVLPVAPLPALPQAVFDPVAAEAEWNRLQQEMAQVGAAPVDPDVKGKGKRVGDGFDAAAKKVKQEPITILSSDKEDEVRVMTAVKLEVKREGKGEKIAGVKKEKGSTMDLTLD